jgi:hypothetical protein
LNQAAISVKKPVVKESVNEREGGHALKIPESAAGCQKSGSEVQAGELPARGKMAETTHARIVWSPILFECCLPETGLNRSTGRLQTFIG